jgi:hypothetical protein
MSKTAKQTAEDLLAHYLGTAFRSAGALWNEDNDAEVGAIVDAFERMAAEAAAVAVECHHENEHRHDDVSAAHQ